MTVKNKKIVLMSLTVLLLAIVVSFFLLKENPETAKPELPAPQFCEDVRGKQICN